MGTKQSGEYRSDVTDEEWAFVLPYLLLWRENSPQRKPDLRTVFNAVRYVARTGGQWRDLPNDLPPWVVVYQQMQRRLPGGLRDDCARRALPGARVGGTQRATDRRGCSQSAPAVHARSRPPS